VDTSRRSLRTGVINRVKTKIKDLVRRPIEKDVGVLASAPSEVRDSKRGVNMKHRIFIYAQQLLLISIALVFISCQAMEQSLKQVDNALGPLGIFRRLQSVRIPARPSNKA